MEQTHSPTKNHYIRSWLNRKEWIEVNEIKQRNSNLLLWETFFPVAMLLQCCMMGYG